MQISVKNAYANNLKNIFTDIPIGKITALTGVSGSGKSTLLREVLGAYGAKNYTRIASKTVKDALLISDDIAVDEVDNLPNTIFIDVKNNVSNPISTVSTVSGIHELLRNLFVEYGEIKCEKCGSAIVRDYSMIKQLSVDLIIDDKFREAIEFIENNGTLEKIEYFDKKGNHTENEKKKTLATVYFSLNNINEKLVKLFNKNYSCSICVISETAKKTYDFIKEIECPSCSLVGPNLMRSRMSYSTSYDNGGGACRCCNGTGKCTQIRVDRIFNDKTKAILDGASSFITPKGIKYSTVTEKFIDAVYGEFNCEISTSIMNLPSKLENAILYGLDHEITFMDRIGGRKTLVYEGLSSYLDSAYRANKGGNAVLELFDEYDCKSCKGTRFDKSIGSFVFCGKTINDLMAMTLSELGIWCEEIYAEAPKKAHKYIERIIKETGNFKLLSCGHLTLSRYSNTLSGGELQRIRICALLNADIHGLCYLLDEPSSGLHYSDIENLVVLLKRVCKMGNTVIMVEHNKKMLNYCDHIIDLGPFGGSKGGNILFGVDRKDIGNYDTETAKIMNDTKETDLYEDVIDINEKQFLEFNNLTYNNLKNVSVRFPKNAFTVVCGVSGSGKSTFIKHAVMESIKLNPHAYGFKGVDYLGQASRAVNNQSTVSTLMKIGDYIAELFEKAAKSKIKKNNFILGSKEGKCPCCGGKGRIFSTEDEFIGICDQCEGYGFTKEVLNIVVDGLNIFDFYNTNMDELGNSVKDSKIKKIAEIAGRLGVGYLTFARQSKTLSKGELQRVLLTQILMGKENNHIYVLDEPSKGLHESDVKNLVHALREITEAGNTILVVEHSPEMIKNADYIIEFGGTGVDGGYVLFQGRPNDISGTPTAKMLLGIDHGEIENNLIQKENIVIDDNGNSVNYKPYKIYYDEEHKEALLRAAQKSRDDFLSVAIPNNSMFSRLDRNIIESDVPIMMVIDFKEKIKYNISVNDALGIRNLLSKAVAKECSDNLAKYIFDPTSSTGKCITCKGTGKTMEVDKSFFLDGGELNTSCKKFLKNSTDYAKLSKLMKKDGIDITKNVSLMSFEEQKILFWGTDLAYEMEGKTKRWEGIIPLFLQYHGYYPDKDAVAVFKKKSEIECPICSGARIKTKYSKYTCCGMSYREWMSLPISELVEKISSVDEEHIKIIKERLGILCDIGLDKLLLSDELISMDEISAAKIKLVSIYYNRIFSMGLVVNNINIIEKKELGSIKDMLEDLSKTNTVWVL